MRFALLAYAEAAPELTDRIRDRLTASGELVHLVELADGGHTRTLSTGAAGVLARDGELDEPGRRLVAFGIVDCESYDRATHLAARLVSGLPGAVAVRPVMTTTGSLDV
ncbi:hypothetical protein LX16_1337 [Stackebrandtia albiflava]|uniref:YCII-related domain-containing protein n=1 Tax=Stackebrandtia albiflava TaxID=406432 RepID=A0A562VCM1_9ACTN|nr:hypothetical protein [Stackebrandtia albiflava]TWJ15626.1 hypothetical protein LX16_1337 [Stackebrandtia albiflava]